jgi:hypothetical protein
MFDALFWEAAKVLIGNDRQEARSFGSANAGISALATDAWPVITGNKIRHGLRFPCGWDERDAKV